MISKNNIWEPVKEPLCCSGRSKKKESSESSRLVLDTDALHQYVGYNHEEKLFLLSLTNHVFVDLERNFRNERQSPNSGEKRAYIFRGPLYFISSFSKRVSI